MVPILALLGLVATASAAPYYIVLTDPHLDTTYKEGSPVSCVTGAVGLPCCHVTDVGSGKAGPYGEDTCDVSSTFFTELLAELKKSYPDPDMIFFLGDAAPHTVVTATDKWVVDSYTTILDAINATWYGVPVYPLQGNHDTYPCNELRVKARGSIITSLSELWNSYGYVSGEEERKTLSDWLYYTRVHRKGHRIIGVNSLWTYGSNSLLPKDEDPAGMRAWLTTTLDKAVAANEKVWLLGHIRPVGGNNHAEYVQWFTDILGKYPGVILRQHYGHSHTDELHVIRPSINGNATTVCFVHPAITSYEGIWPSVRVAHFDTNTLEETDITTYHVDITASNKAHKVSLIKHYEFAEEYGMKDLTQASWNELASSMLTNEHRAATYLRLKATAGDEPLPLCDELCRRNVFCDMNYMPDELRSKCNHKPI